MFPYVFPIGIDLAASNINAFPMEGKTETLSVLTNWPPVTYGVQYNTSMGNLHYGSSDTATYNVYQSGSKVKGCTYNTTKAYINSTGFRTEFFCWGGETDQ